MPIGLTSDIQRMRDLLKKLRKPSPVRERLDAGRTVFLPPEEAKEAGLPGDYPADWMLKITPGRNGDEPTFSYRSPEGQEFAEPPFVPEAVAREEFLRERPELRPPVPEIEPEDPRAEIASLTATTKRLFPDLQWTISLGMPYGTDLDIALNKLVQLANESPTQFIERITSEGRTEDSENLLRLFVEGSVHEDGTPYTPEEIDEAIDEIFPPVVPTPPQFEVPSWLTLDFWKEALFRPYAGEDLASKAYFSFVAGIGDVITTTGGAARWLGYEDVGGVLSTIGSKLQSVAPPDTSGEFEMADLLNPEFYATKIARTVPFSLSLAPLAIGGFYGGTAIATSLGLGRLASWIIGGFSGAALSRPLESALEAGSQYDDAIARGKTEKEATEEANEVFRKNMLLAGMDAFQISIALAPTPKWVPLGLVRAGLVRTIRIGGKMVIVGLTEGGEEVYQDMVQRHARGEEWQLDPIAKEVFAIGMVMGLGMGLGGDVVTGLVDNVKPKMTPDIKGDFDAAVKGFEAEGFRTDQAELKALDTISQTPEGEKIVTETIKEMREAVPPPVEKPPVPVIPEVVPEVRALTEDVWNISPVVDRASWAKLAGLEGKVGSKAWADLTTGEKDALRLSREEIAPTLPEVKPPVVEEVKPEVFMTQEQWGTLSQQARSKALAEAGLDRAISERGWDELTALEREELTGEVYTEPDAPLMPEQRTDIDTLAKEKLIMTEEGKPKPQLRNLMKGLVGKTRIEQLTQSEADTVVEALGLLEVKYGRPPKIPTTAGLITAEFADKIPHLKEIGIIEKVRPTRQVFEKMGLRKEIFEPTLRAEVVIYEELQAFRKEARAIEKLVGKDPERRRLVFQELENPGTVVGLTFNEKRAVTWFRKYFDDWANKLNLPIEKRRKNYVTHIFEAEMAEELKTKHPLDPEMIKALDFITPKTIFNPYLQQRLGQEIGLKEDPFAAISAYEARALKVYHYEPLIQKIRVYEKYLPPHSAKYLRNFITRITGRPLTIDRELNQTIGEFAEKISALPGGKQLADHMTRGNFGGLTAYQFTSALYFLWLGFKPTSAIRNLSQHTLHLAEVGPINFAEGIRLRATSEGKTALKESLVLRSRRQAFIPGIDASFASQWTDKFRETALWMFRQADRQNVSDAFLSGYAEMKRNFPEAGRDWWIKRGDEVAADTQYIYSQMGSAAWSQSAMGRFLSVLTTWPENWIELMTRFVKGRPSYVMNEYAESVGKPVPKKNWLEARKAMLLYMAIVAMGFVIKEETRLKAWEYTGLTSLRYLADLAGGEFPALQYPGAVMNVIIGFLTDDERRLKTGWTQLKPVNLMGIIRSLDNVVSGEKDWLTLLFYLEGEDWKIKQLKDRWEKEFEAYPLFRDEEGEYDVDLKLEYIRTHPKQAGWSDAKIRDQWREDNPKLEAKMFVVGQFTTLSSDEARAEVLRLIEEHKLDPDLIKGYEKVFGVDTTVELKKSQNRIGNLEKLEVGVEAEYFTMNDFASEVNRLEKLMGRYKLEKDGSPLAIEYLRAKDQWEAYYDLPEDGRRLYRQQFPELEAQLYLWGKVQAFENPKSAEILLGLMKKYDIPPEGIRAFIEKPERYDELFTQKFKLEQKWFDQTTEYENFGNTEAPNYIEDAELRKEAREKFKEVNPDWVADMRRIEAIDNEAPPEIIENWVERGHIIDEFGAGSSEAMVWLLDNRESFDWALENELLTDEGTDWNEPVLRINVKWREQDNKYLGFGDETSEFYIADETERMVARDKLLLDEEYRKDRRRREAYGDGFSDDQIENFVTYHELPVKGYEQERFLLDIPKFAREMHEIKGLDLPDPTKVPSPKYDEIYESRSDDFDKLWGLANHKSEHYIENEKAREEARQAMRFDAKGNPTNFYKDELRLDAYKLFIPEEHIESYVTMAVEPEKGYRKERFLMEHQDYYKTVWLGILKNDRIDVRKIPAKQYDDIYDRFKAQFDKWDAYKDLDSPLYIADPDERAKARERLLLDEAFAEARIRQAGYLTLIGHEEHVDSYVTYYQLLAVGKPEDVDVWYEDDWFLIENPEFYKVVREALGWEKRDFSKVPIREVFRLYQIYRRLPKGKIRENYRAQHTELDKWMVLAGLVSKTVEEQEALAELSKAERLALKMWEIEKERGEELEESLEEMRRRLEELTR